VSPELSRLVALDVFIFIKSYSRQNSGGFLLHINAKFEIS
jgi:hypothetical protein